jgi:hypothetical protein
MRTFLAVAAVCFTVAVHAQLKPGEFVEGNSGTTPAVLTITRPPNSQGPITGTWRTVDGTATAADGDFVPVSDATFTIGPNEQTTTVTVLINGDFRPEDDELFAIELTNVANSPVTVTIVNDDIAISVGNVQLAEGNAGTSRMLFDIVTSTPHSFPAVVTYQTANGTAIAGVDYEIAAGTVIFAPGVTVQTIPVNVIGDTAIEPDETFTFTATYGTPVTATATILNDDSLPPPSAVTAVSGGGQQGRPGRVLAQPLIVRVTDRFGAPVAGVNVEWVVTQGQAEAAPSSSVTDADGRASTNVTPRSVGEIRVEARVTQVGAVTFTLNSATNFEDRAEGPVARPIARALDVVCARNDTAFSAVCLALAVLPDEGLTHVLERAAPQQSGAQSKIAAEVISAVTSGIASRLAAVRTGERFSAQRLAVNWNGHTVPLGALMELLMPARLSGMQGAASGGEESDYNGWGAFVSGNLGTGERKARPGELGFDLESRGLMLGVDRLVGDSVFGAAVNFMELDSDLDGDTGSVDTKGYALSVYASRGGLFARGERPGGGLRYDGVHLDGSLTYGRNSYDSEHNFSIGSGPLMRATSENDADVLAVAGVAGIDAHRGRTDFDFSLSGTWSRAQVDDLEESGSGPLILFVQGHEIESLLGGASLNVRGAFPVFFGTLIPSIRGELLHEFEDGARLVTAHFLRDRFGTSFTIPIDQPDGNYGRIGAGLQAEFPYGYSAFVEVTQDVMRDDLRFRTLQFNVRKSF